MTLRMPPTASLRAVEAAARLLSFTRAAEELHITQSAISHQIRHAEEVWGVQLFERRGRRVVTTAAGQKLVPLVRDFLDKVGATLRELHDERAPDELRVTLLQSFAFKWLVPKLGRFRDRHPEIEVWIATSEEIVDFATDNVDVAIRLGHGDWPGMHVTLLLREYVFPVCSPRFLSRVQTPRKPEDLLRYPLLYRHSRDICPRWRDWFADAGVRIRSLPKGIRFPDTSMAIQAALDDQGIALARSAHVADDLRSGRLVKLFDVYSPSTVAYYLVCPKGTENRPAIRAFRDWLVEEAAAAQRDFDMVGGPAPRDTRDTGTAAGGAPGRRAAVTRAGPMPSTA